VSVVDHRRQLELLYAGILLAKKFSKSPVAVNGRVKKQESLTKTQLIDQDIESDRNEPVI
jgi:hypothetical protein